MMTMQSAVLNFLRVHLSCVSSGIDADEAYRRISPAILEIRPHIEVSDGCSADDLPPFDYRLLAEFDPRRVMLLMLQVVANCFDVAKECEES